MYFSMGDDDYFEDHPLILHLVPGAVLGSKNANVNTPQPCLSVWCGPGTHNHWNVLSNPVTMCAGSSRTGGVAGRPIRELGTEIIAQTRSPSRNRPLEGWCCIWHVMQTPFPLANPRALGVLPGEQGAHLRKPIRNHSFHAGRVSGRSACPHLTSDGNKITALFMVMAALSCHPADDTWEQSISGGGLPWRVSWKM